MKVPILIGPTEEGGFRACAGEPFNVSAEGQTEDSAAQQLTNLLRQRLQNGARLGVVDLGALPQEQLQFDPLPDDDWFFQSMRDAIAENRQKEDEIEPGWLPNDELTQDWIKSVHDYRSECDADDQRRLLNGSDSGEAS